MKSPSQAERAGRRPMPMRLLGIAVVTLCVASFHAPRARAQQDQLADRIVAAEEAPTARTRAAAGAPMLRRAPPPTGPGELL